MFFRSLKLRPILFSVPCLAHSYTQQCQSSTLSANRHAAPRPPPSSLLLPYIPYLITSIRSTRVSTIFFQDKKKTTAFCAVYTACAVAFPSKRKSCSFKQRHAATVCRRNVGWLPAAIRLRCSHLISKLKSCEIKFFRWKTCIVHSRIIGTPWKWTKINV